MLKKKMFLFASFLICISTSIFSQSSLVEYLTEVNLSIEAKVLKEYCDCLGKKDFIDAYNDVSITINKSINAHLVELSGLRAKKALEKFETINKSSSGLNGLVQTQLNTLLNFDCSGSLQKYALPTAISIAEFTGVANSIIGLINSGKERRNARRDKLIAILESLKIPSIQAYECKADD